MEGLMDVQVNMWAVVLATLSSVAVGMVWYHPKVLGGKWVKLAKIDPKKGDMKWSMGSVWLSSFVLAYVLAHFITLAHSYFVGNSFWRDAINTAFWVWIGFQALRNFMHDQFNQRRKKETLIHMGNDLVTIIVMAIIIGVMGVK
jgi:hypothetical protein